MSVSQESITAIFDRNGVALHHREDPEMLGAAYAIAFMDEAKEGPDATLYASTLNLTDDEEIIRYSKMPLDVLLQLVYEDRLFRRSVEIEIGEQASVCGDWCTDQDHPQYYTPTSEGYDLHD